MNTWETFNVAIPMATDSYKAGHWNQSPVGTELISSYMESRGSKLADFTNFDDGFESAVDEMVTVFENGEILKEYSFGEVRETAKI